MIIRKEAYEITMLRGRFAFRNEYEVLSVVKMMGKRTFRGALGSAPEVPGEDEAVVQVSIS